MIARQGPPTTAAPTTLTRLIYPDRDSLTSSPLAERLESLAARKRPAEPTRSYGSAADFDQTLAQNGLAALPAGHSAPPAPDAPEELSFKRPPGVETPRLPPSRPAPVAPVATVRCAANIEMATVDWLWQDRLPLGHLALVAGEPGVGKSFLAIALAAAVSLGAGLPGGPEAVPANVLLIPLEDDPATIVVPRLTALGADLQRIHILAGVKVAEEDSPFSLPLYASALAEAILSHHARLVVLDPLVAALDSGADLNSQTSMRRILQPLVTIAHDTGAAILVVHHLRKGASADPAHRVNGSIDLLAAPRSVILVGRDQQYPDRRGVAVVKSNFAAYPTPLAFSLSSGGFEWIGEDARLTPDHMFAVPGSTEERGSIDEAKEFLLQELARGPVLTKELNTRAAQLGVSSASLRRARPDLGIICRKRAGDGKWEQSLPFGEQDEQVEQHV